MNKVYLVLDKDRSYALFYTNYRTANIVKAKLEEEGSTEVTITTFHANLTVKQVLSSYSRGNHQRVLDSTLKNVLKPHYAVRIE